MFGAIIGDVVGSRFEFKNHRDKQFELVVDNSKPTDDSVLTIALMDWALTADIRDSYSVIRYLQKWGRRYPNAGYGGRFSSWLWSNNPQPYNSKGNGSGMRVSPVAYIAKSKSELYLLSDLVTSVTHNHREGIKGARAIAYATYMALNGSSKEEIRCMAESYYPEIAKFNYENLKANYKFNELSETTCPQAIYCFLISKDFEDCLRISVAIGGDTDTLCAMSCAIAEAYYKQIPQNIVDQVWNKLDLQMQSIVSKFYETFANNNKPTHKFETVTNSESMEIINTLERIIGILETNPEIEYEIPKGNIKPNQLVIAYPKYPKWVFDIEKLFTPLINYSDYLSKIEKQGKTIDEYNIYEIRASLTHFVRGERFCNGHMAACIKDGSLKKWLKRYKELIEQEK